GDYWDVGFLASSTDTSGAYFYWYNHSPAGSTAMYITSDKGNAGWLNTGIPIDDATNLYSQFYSSGTNRVSISTNNGISYAYSYSIAGTASGAKNFAGGFVATETGPLKLFLVRLRKWVEPPPQYAIGLETVTGIAADGPDHD